MPAPYSGRAVANYFLARDHLTQVKLHKLLYYSHGWHFGLRDAPLLDETLVAWRYGPVVPSIYREFAHFPSEPIDRPAMVFDPISENWIVPRVDHSDDFVRDIWPASGKCTET